MNFLAREAGPHQAISANISRLLPAHGHVVDRRPRLLLAALAQGARIDRGEPDLLYNPRDGALGLLVVPCEEEQESLFSRCRGTSLRPQPLVVHRVESLYEPSVPQVPGYRFGRREPGELDLAVPTRVVVHGVYDDLAREPVGAKRLVSEERHRHEHHLAEVRDLLDGSCAPAARSPPSAAPATPARGSCSPRRRDWRPRRASLLSRLCSPSPRYRWSNQVFSAPVERCDFVLSELQRRRGDVLLQVRDR